MGSVFIDNDKANKAIDDTDKKGQGLGATFAKWGAAAAAAGAAAALAFGTVAANAAVKFEKEMANVSTLLDGDVKKRISELGENVKQLAGDTGTSTSLLTDGLYQVVSAFGDSAASMGILETASKGAAAGNATVTDSVNLLAAVTKGYGDTSEEAALKASDLAFLTVKLGQTSFPELASAMGKVIPLAATMKVSQEELFGAMATLTGVTGGTAEVTTQLRGAIQGFMQPSKQMADMLKKLGYENGQAALEAEGLGGILNSLKDAVGGNEIAFAGLFGSVEAKSAVLALTGAQAENFAEKVKAMGDAAGSTEEAFTRQQATVSAMWEKLKVNADVLFISLGEKLLPILNQLLEVILKNMPQIKAFFEDAFSAAGKVMGWVADNVIPRLVTAFDGAKTAVQWVIDNWPTLGPIIKGIGAVIATIMIPQWIALGVAATVNAAKNVAAWVLMQAASVAASAGFYATTALMIAQWAFLGVQSLLHAAKVALAWVIAMGPIAWVIAAVAGLVIALALYWDEIKEAITKAWEAVKAFFSQTWENIRTIFSDALSAIKTAVGTAFQWMYDHNYYFEALVDAISAAWGRARDTTVAVWSAISNFLINLWAWIRDTAQSMWDSIFKVIGDITGRIRDITNEVWTAISSFLTNLWTRIRNTAQAMWGLIFGVIKSITDRIQGLFGDLVSRAWNWGANLLGNFIDGIKSKWASLTDTLSNVGSTIAGFLGFHSPTKLGPGRDADKWAPALMQMLAEGIAKSAGMLRGAMTDAVANINPVVATSGAGVTHSTNRTTNNTPITIHVYGGWDEIRRELEALGVTAP